MYGISSMRSEVVKRFSHFRHSRRRRMDSPSLLSRESTTLSLTNPQNGHFMVEETKVYCKSFGRESWSVAGRDVASYVSTMSWPRLKRVGETLTPAGETPAIRQPARLSSAFWLARVSWRKEICSKWA